MSIQEEKYKKAIEGLKKGEFDSALKLLNDLIHEFPNNAEYTSERGVVYFHLKNKKMALADMDKAVELEPKKSYRYSSRAYIKGGFGKTEEAIEDYRIAIELDPDDAIAYNNLGLLQEQLGYKDKAKLSFKNADKLAGINRGREELGIEGEEIPTRNIQKEIEEEREKTTLWSTIKSLNSKEGKESFVRFVKSGFKKL